MLGYVPAMSKSHWKNSRKRPRFIWGWSRRYTRAMWYRLMFPVLLRAT